jgi:hypothetical protein
MRAGVIDNSGDLSSSEGVLQLTGNDIKFDAPEGARARVVGASDVFITANDLKLRNTDLEAGSILGPLGSLGGQELAALHLDVQTRLSDGGADAANEWLVTDGVRLLRHPAEGDLFGTRLTISGEPFAEVVSVWAGEDRGPVASGFTNNTTLGTLSLEGELLTLFTFQGTAPGQAMYVEFLEFVDQATNLLQNLNIAEGFTLYFADSNLSAEELDGLFDGRLRWVPDFAGPSTAVTVTLAGGARVKMNRALVHSRTIDSDGDGMVNALDPHPFDAGAIRIRVARTRDGANEIAWFASPSASYRVEYATSLETGAWQTLAPARNAEARPRDLTVRDAVTAGEPARFYRVVLDR